uniref:Transmembrane protein n=1 Tax=Heterorhabditis bacteriophora TaxID=37862 RepID=A0A1I7WQW9_HETBA
MKRVPHGYIRPINYARLVVILNIMSIKGGSTIRCIGIIVDQKFPILDEISYNVESKYGLFIKETTHYGIKYKKGHSIRHVRKMFYPSFLTMSIHTIFVIIFRSVLAKSKFGHLCKGKYFRRHVNWIPATMACCTDIQVYGLLIAEILLSIVGGIDSGRCGESANSNSQLHDVDWSREILKSVRISAYYLVVFFEIKNQDVCSSNHL